MIKPISTSAKLNLNTKPKLKILLTIHFQDVSLVLSKAQFDNILEMIESFEKAKSLKKIKEKRPIDNEWYVVAHYIQ